MFSLFTSITFTSIESIAPTSKMSSDCSYFDSPYIRGSVAVLAFFVLLFALAAVSYAISQRRIPSPFKVTRWYSYGLTLLLWNL